MAPGPIPAVQSAMVRRAIDALGAARAATLLRVTAPTLAKLAAGMSVARGTRAIVRLNLDATMEATQAAEQRSAQP